jgi:hypothetical protein
VALVAAPLGRASSAIRCDHSNIDGDHVAPANEFVVRGLSCSYALFAATGLTDGADRYNVFAPGVERFNAVGHGGSYRWTCRTSALRHPHVARPRETGTNAEEPGTYYRCEGRGALDGQPMGTAYMSFKWWLIGVHECRTFPLRGSTSEAADIEVTRNVTCPQAERWIATVTREIQHSVRAYKHEYETRFYRYYDSAGTNSSNAPGDGTLYDCLTVPDTELHQDRTSTWVCRPPHHPFAGSEYQWVRKPRGTAA